LKSEKKNIAVVIIALNEEKSIKESINSLKNQTLPPYRIIIVNDGSTDNTEKIVRSFSDVEIINRKPHESYVGKKELATTFNAGLEKLDNDIQCNYILVLGSDVILPNNYLSKIIKRMNENAHLVISSGIIEGEYSVTPRGAGRVVKYDFWKDLGLKYPVNYGFEGYLILKAKSLGFEVEIFNDLILTTKRKTGQRYNPKLYYYYGLGIKALGYSIPYALGRISILGKKTPRGAFKMLQGFLSNYDELYEPELREYVKKTQRNNILHMDFDFVKKIFHLVKHS
jgi:glycosyltransferase involved in cell wall biosynthesis